MQKHKDRQDSYRKVYGNPGIYRNYGACILADLQCDRRMAFRSAGYGNNLADGCHRRGTDSRPCERCTAVTHCGRNFYGCGQCAQLSADHCHTVLLPLDSGRQRLYGESGLVMDKLLRKIGLSGRSIVPMLIGFGCTVPSVMACRTLASERDRKMTILLTPFMSCSAKLPIYAFFYRRVLSEARGFGHGRSVFYRDPGQHPDGFCAEGESL